MTIKSISVRLVSGFLKLDTAERASLTEKIPINEISRQNKIHFFFFFPYMNTELSLETCTLLIVSSNK